MKSHEIVPRDADSSHGRLSDKAGMRTMPMVAMQPSWQFSDAVGTNPQPARSRCRPNNR
jgi:hypothetical protein